MKAPKSIFVCTECGYETPKWMGKCPSCAAWNSFEEQLPAAPATLEKAKKILAPEAQAKPIDEL